MGKALNRLEIASAAGWREPKREIHMHVRNHHFTTLGLRVLMVALLTVGLVATAGAFPRKVLLEEYTSTTCPPCHAFAPSLEAALEQLGAGIVATSVFHMNWPAPGDDPWYADNAADNGGRRGYYGVNGVPDLYINGSQSNARTTAAVVQAVRAAAQQAAPCAISIVSNMENGTAHVTVSVQNGDVAIANAKLFVSLTEKQAHYRTPNWADWTEHYNPMVKMIPTYNGTVVNLAANEQRDYSFQQNMAGLGWHELETNNLIMNAWIQNAQRQVLQAANVSFVPAIQMTDGAVSDAGMGDGDGRAEPGETAGVSGVFHNDGLSPALPNYTITLNCDDPGITVLGDPINGEVLNGGESVEVYATDLRFEVARDFVAHPVTFVVTLRCDELNIEVNQDITVMVGWPPILDIDATAYARAEQVMNGVYGHGDFPWSDGWNRVDMGVPPEELLPNYRAILWHSFNNANDPINEFEADMLVGYLDNGGTLIISSTDLPDALAAHPLWTRYVNARVADADANQLWVVGMPNMAPFTGADMVLGGGAGAGTPAHVVSLTPQVGSTAVLRYDDGGQNAGVAALKHETDTYRVLYMGFPMESVCGAAGSQDSLKQLMDRVWTWVQERENSVGGGAAPTPGAFLLNPAYPNPFNAMTTIGFSVPSSGSTSLRVFDIRGREVGTLLNGITPAGNHSTTLNASNLGLGAGIYYIRLDAANQSQTGKLIYLK